SSATKCIYSSTAISKTKKIYYEGSHYGMYDWENENKELQWNTINYISTTSYSTRIDVSDISEIDFYDSFVRYGTSGAYAYAPYFTAETGLTTLEWSEPYGTGGTTPTVGTNLSNTIWKQNANVNNTIPVLKDLYW
ncbi:MAG: hypothetical protein IJA69_01290, partial [Clostridia bacterium]|nr:hypothetical protein [Clostridia bacterium]